MSFVIFFFFSPGEGFLYHKLPHLTTIYFTMKNNYFSYTIFLLEHNKIFLEHNQISSEHNRSFSEHKRIFSSSQSTIESCRTTIESFQSTMKSFQSTMKSSESRNTRKFVGFFITWLLYSQNPLRSNMAQPYRLIVWI